MAKRKVNKPPMIVPGPETIEEYDREAGLEIVKPISEIFPPLKRDADGAINITINHGGKIDTKKILEAIRLPILETPGPWSREWLDRNGLEVQYKHGRATLRFKGK